MIRKRLFLLWITILSAVCTVNGQKLREIHILAANDMHATIEAFPQLGAIADSLRELYPSLLVFSAGDNRTGNPKNDMFRISSYPMTMLMNLVGFDATALGNHEFDVNSLPPLMNTLPSAISAPTSSPLKSRASTPFPPRSLMSMASRWASSA